MLSVRAGVCGEEDLFQAAASAEGKPGEELSPSALRRTPFSVASLIMVVVL